MESYDIQPFGTGFSIQHNPSRLRHVSFLGSFLLLSSTEHGEGKGTPLQYSRLENPMGGAAWWAAVHGVTKSQTRLSDFTFTFPFHALEKEMATHSSVHANPTDGGAWWAAVHGVTKSQTLTERLHYHFSLSCTGEGNGNPLQRSCQSHGWQSLVGCRLWGRTESDT